MNRLAAVGQVPPSTVWWARPVPIVAALALLMFGAVVWNELRLAKR